MSTKNPELYVINKMSKLFIFTILLLTSLASFSNQIFDVKSKQEILEKLEYDGIKPGMTIWLREPLKIYDEYIRIPGLSKLIFIDADILPEFKSFPNSNKHIIITVQDNAEKSVQLILEDSTRYFTGSYGTALKKIYTNDPNKLSPKWNKRVIEAINARMLIMGMTPDQIRASWGSPDKVNSSTGSWGRKEQWIYGDFPNSTYLYIQNGKLTSWQN